MSSVCLPNPLAAAAPQPASSAAPWGRREWLITAALSAAVLVAYSPVFTAGFVNYDDPTYLTENPNIKLGLSLDGLRWGLTTLYFSNWHPLVWWSFLLDHAMYGFDPAGYHLTNLLWHIGSTLVLFAALRRMTGDVWPSALAAALFALHPLNVQAVAWVSERKGVISTFFWMLTLWCYARYAERPSLRRYALVAISLALGLMAKQMLVTLPFVLLLLDFWPLRRWRAGGVSPLMRHQGAYAPRSALLLEKLPLLALAFTAGIATLFAQASYESVAPLHNISVTARVNNALVSVLVYLRQACLPVDLAAFYPHPGDSLPAWQALAAAIAILGVTGIVLFLARRLPYLAVGWLWYLGTLMPVIGLIQVGDQAHADRYAYVPLVGIYIAVSWGLADLARRSQLAVYVARLIEVGLTAVTFVQAQHWHDSVALWEHALAVTGHNAVACQNLGAALLPTDKRAALKHLHDALECNPDYPLAHLSLGLIWTDWGDNAKAAEHYRRSLTLSPANPNLAVAQYHLGLVLQRQGERDAAAVHFREALRLNPADELACLNLGIIAKDQGDAGTAIQYLRHAIHLEPRLIAAHYHLGLAYVQQRDSPQARACLREAARLAQQAGQIELVREIEKQLRDQLDPR